MTKEQEQLSRDYPAMLAARKAKVRAALLGMSAEGREKVRADSLHIISLRGDPRAMFAQINLDVLAGL